MKRLRWGSVVLGAVTFGAAHALLVATWTSWFGPEWNPWFLNSGRAAGFTAVCLLVAGSAASVSWARDRHDAVVHGVNVAAGAALAMVVVLVVVGPGTIYPIALAFGGAIALVSTTAGSLMAWALTPHWR